MTWRESINQKLGKISLSEQNFVRGSGIAVSAPIDNFYRNSGEIVRFGTPALLSSEPFLGPLLVVGIVSATEEYFRSIFGAAIDRCSICRKNAADQKISLGSALWHGHSSIAKGALEHLSLADSAAIKNSSDKFLGFAIKRGQDTESALHEFDKICQLRHGVVHTASALPGTNAMKLGFPLSSGPTVIKVDFAQLQEAALVCRSLVTSYNLELFEVLVRRWAINWDPRKDATNFRSLWNAFASKADFDNGNIPNPLTMIKCRNQILKEFP